MKLNLTVMNANLRIKTGDYLEINFEPIKVRSNHAAKQIKADLEEPPLNITERIHARRTELGIESHVLSHEIGLDYDMVLEWEDRGGEPVASLIPKLATALKCDPMWLINGITISTPNSVGDLGEDGVLFTNQLGKLTNAVEQAETIVTNTSGTTLGDRIKIRRKALGFSRLDVALLLGVKDGAISMWERDASSPTCNKLAKLAEALKCDPRWLMFGETEVRGKLSYVRNDDVPQLADTIQPNQLIADRICERRIELKMRIEKLAAALGIDICDIEDWETYKCKIDAEYIPALATALQCDPMWLMTGKPLPEIVANHPIEVLQNVDWKGMGTRIKQFREEQNISHDDLASFMHVCPAQVIAWEQGSMPANGYIDLIAKALGCRTMWLITGKGDPEIENAGNKSTH